MSTSAAGRARQKAQARRQRILARGAERLDVVNGLGPRSPAVIEDATAPAAVVSPSPPTCQEGGIEGADQGAAEPAAPQRPSGSARRMAAMRKRRSQAKNKLKEDQEDASKVDDDSAHPVPACDVKENNGDVCVAEAAANEGEAALAVESKEVTHAATPSATRSNASASTKKEDKENNIPNPTTGEKKEAEAPKKYKGVARMRRQILKEKKAQRLKDISDAEILTSGATSGDLEREIAAEMATMNLTMTMTRKGGMGTADSKSNFSAAAMKNGGFLKKRKKWYSVLLPPMKMMPRLVMLLLLFFAGFDLGSQPYYSGGSQTGRAAAPSHVLGDGVAAKRDRELTSLSVVGTLVNLIHHKEHSFTKPWEYGMGGKAAYMMGMAPSSPPTAMPTAFDAEMVCINDSTEEECVASPDKDAKEQARTKGDKGKKKKTVLKVQLLEDQFDSSRTRPRGVSHDDEFDDAPPLAGNPHNIDPLLGVDLDLLLENARLPYVIEKCATLAIGFHRTWVYYLWTLPASLVKSLARFPKIVVSGWLANPPWILGVTLVIRLLVTLLLGDVSADRTKQDADGGGGDTDQDGGGAGKKQDMYEKGIDFAKNYAMSYAPKTVLVLGTLIKVMKVDMYVVLCGLYIGLVIPSVQEDYLAPTGRSFKSMAWPVLGQGEL